MKILNFLQPLKCSSLSMVLNLWYTRYRRLVPWLYSYKTMCTITYILWTNRHRYSLRLILSMSAKLIYELAKCHFFTIHIYEKLIFFNYQSLIIFFHILIYMYIFRLFNYISFVFFKLCLLFFPILFHSLPFSSSSFSAV